MSFDEQEALRRKLSMSSIVQQVHAASGVDVVLMKQNAVCTLRSSISIPSYSLWSVLSVGD